MKLSKYEIDEYRVDKDEHNPDSPYFRGIIKDQRSNKMKENNGSSHDRQGHLTEVSDFIHQVSIQLFISGG